MPISTVSWLYRILLRPIFALAFCQLMVAVGVCIRVYAGHEAIVCDRGEALKHDAGGDGCLAVSAPGAVCRLANGRTWNYAVESLKF